MMSEKQAQKLGHSIFYPHPPMEGMIPTGHYVLICDFYRSHRREGLITDLVVIQAIWVSDRPLWLKCLLQNPLLWFKYQILIGSFRILLNYAFQRKGAGGGGVWKKNGMSHSIWWRVTIYPDLHQYSMEFLCLFLKPHFTENSGGVANCRLIFQSTESKAILFFK